jgi:alkylhydroperoxidase family enzyme
MRIPVWNPEDAPRDAAVVDAVLKRRGGKLLRLDEALLWSEPLARGWNAYLGEVRQNFAVDKRLKELAICTVAKLTGAQYEYDHHKPHYLAAGGTAALVDSLDDVDSAITSTIATDDEKLAMRYALAMTRSVKVPDVLFRQMKSRFSTTELVELTAAIAAYNMVARFLVALEVTD